MSDWILKWTATFTLIAGTLVNSLGYYPQGVIMLILGSVFWLIVAVRWQDSALITTNLIMGLTGLLGLVYKYLIS